VIGHEIGHRRAEELLRFVRALGQHRYVASRLHLVHAFAFTAATTAEPDPALADAAAWAERVLRAGSILDLGSRDERLFRRATDAELLALLATFWTPGDASERAKTRLRELLASIDAARDEAEAPFDESREEEIFPVLVDAGWELLPLAQLHHERHKGAILAFDDFEVARFEEQEAIPPIVTLSELPTLGAVELLTPFDDEGLTRAPFVVWLEGNDSYVDYVLRGVLRASKIELDDE
jgi:hypothetical protein